MSKSSLLARFALKTGSIFAHAVLASALLTGCGAQGDDPAETAAPSLDPSAQAEQKAVEETAASLANQGPSAELPSGGENAPGALSTEATDKMKCTSFEGTSAAGHYYTVCCFIGSVYACSTGKLS